MKKMLEKLKNGVSICIFPEGTRNKGEEGTLLSFKEGSFKMATKAGCPIVPIAINNTADIWEAHFPTMKKTRKNPYATNEGGMIRAIHTSDQPAATVRRGTDLRVGR